MPVVSIRAPFLSFCCALALASVAAPAHAVSSAELYTTASYPYGRFEARVQFAGGDGVVGSFFLWKDGSEQDGVFWNELDLETVWANCELFTNALYGNPEMVHSESSGTAGNWCGSFHTYTYEWTPDYIAWFVDGTELRRETGEDAAAFRDNVPAGMQIHFNVWPGDSTFGGNFSPAILPLHQYVNWVQYYSYADGAFNLEWREDFGGDTLPEGWATGDWGSPKGLSTHSAANVAFIDGYAVLSMTADDATGSMGAAPMDPEGGGPPVEPEAGGEGGGPPVEPEAGEDPTPPEPPDGEMPTGPAASGGSAGDDGSPPDDGEPVDGAGGAVVAPTNPGAAGMNDDGAPSSPSEPVPGTSPPSVTGAPPAQTGTPQAPETGAPMPAPGEPSGQGGNTTIPPAMTPPPEPAPSVAPPTTSAAPTVTNDVAEDDGGCGCRVTTSPAHLSAWSALILAVVTGCMRRRMGGSTNGRAL